MNTTNKEQHIQHVLCVSKTSDSSEKYLNYAVNGRYKKCLNTCYCVLLYFEGHTISANRMAPKIYTHDYDDCDMKMSNFTFQGVRKQATTKFPFALLT